MPITPPWRSTTRVAYCLVLSDKTGGLECGHRNMRGHVEGHSSCVRSVAFNHDGSRIVSGSYDKTVRVWNAATGTCEATLTGHDSYVLSVAFNHDGSRIVRPPDKTVRV